MKRLAILVAMASLLLVTACTIKENGESGKDKKVDIKTPFGSLKVNEDVDVRDTGLPLYAGAKRYTSGNDSHGANVNISSGLFGFKVVAIEFTTTDSPDKVRDFYANALKTYGNVVVCQGEYSTHMESDKEHDKDLSKPVDCSDSHGKNPNEYQLKVGTKGHQHVVGVKPDGGGTHFALVYLNTRGSESGS